MNEFSAKKLGEVIAFAKVHQETLDKAKGTWLKVVDNRRFSELTDQIAEQAKLLAEVAQENQVTDQAGQKAEKTGTKLRTMRDGYIGEQWDNPAELLEWYGFFSGAGLVHWQLVLGVSEKLRQFKLIALSNQAIRYYDELLREVSRTIKDYAQDKA